ncbi:MAG: RluA family pseudouridine synthase [Chloroflexi bacterium]|nr:RluA family pseudouridine synthase [Chloroflexota bacterium]
MSEHRLTVRRTARLDKALPALLPELSRSAAQRLIEAGHVRVNGVARGAGDAVAAGDVIDVYVPPPPSVIPLPEVLPLTILYEDDDVIAIDKPAGLVVHPGAGNASGTLVNALLHHAPDVADVGDEQRPGIVHRLDKETSGVMLVAKTSTAHAALQEQFRLRRIRKTYLALCIGNVQPARGVINKPIARDPSNRQRMAVVPGGREAVTEFVVTERMQIEGRPYSLVRAYPRTGRTHQIRVHFASIGFPIVGDLLYGAGRDLLSKRIAPRHLLHASEIRFRLPATGEERALYAPLPEDMRVLQAGE